MAGRLRDKVAIVTGAGSAGPGWGNGKATSVLFAREGASVFAVDIDAAAADETRAIIEGEGGACAVHRADVTDEAAVEAMVAACLDAFGRIDILHNNVGGSAPGGAASMTKETWDRQMDHNLNHVFLACRHVLPVMERQGGGAIVNVASVSGIRWTGSWHIAYDAAKAALIRFSKVVALEYAKKGIRCNTVVPGQMHTPLVEARLARDRTDGDVAALIASRDARVPMGKQGDAWDVAYAAVYLASDEAKYVTATEIVVDGGLTAKCD
jgi:NAD(P)-dependent dehydrogenase (short-subunit alcohol dehydrogenase family)